MYGFDMIFPMNGDINAIIRAAMVLTSAYPLLVNPRSSVTGFVNRLAQLTRGAYPSPIIRIQVSSMSQP